MALYQDFKPVIQLIDNLRDCGIGQKISLPRIAVIGTQSAGKSSLLESIVGIDFLPRGDGVVTRRPLELRLVHLDDPDAPMYARFADEKDADLYDFAQVKAKIEEKTNQIAGIKKGIVNDPIVLTVYSPTCLDLSLVDLPGITRVPLKGSDQTEKIEELTKNMTNKYIQDERTIILCVMPANIDISTSDALQLARKVDPKGERSLGVLTKIDIMDKGTSAIPILKNEVYHLRYGFIAVKNRSQADIKANMDVQTALKAEKEYFENHKELRALSEQVGTEKLAERLSKMLHKHIVVNLPKIEKEIIEGLQKSQKEIQQLGQEFPADNFQKLMYINNKAKEIAEKVKEKIEGKSSVSSNGQFQGYANFNLLISKFQEEKSKLFVSGLNQHSVVDVILEIVEFKGISLPGFLPKEIIDKKIRNELEKLKEPVNLFIDDVKEHNQKILNSIFSEMPSVAGKVKNLLQQKASEFLDELIEKTKAFTMQLIEIQKAMIWTSDAAHFTREIPDNYFANFPSVHQEFLALKEANRDTRIERILLFIRTEVPHFKIIEVKNSIANLKEYLRGKPEHRAKLDQIKKNNLEVSNIVSEQEVIEFYDKLLRYYNIVGRNLNDIIPQTVGKMALKDFFTELESHFTKSIQDNMDELTKIREDASVQRRRETLQDIINKLQKSRTLLNNFNITMGNGVDDVEEEEDENEILRYAELKKPVISTSRTRSKIDETRPNLLS